MVSRQLLGLAHIKQTGNPLKSSGWMLLQRWVIHMAAAGPSQARRERPCG